MGRLKKRASPPRLARAPLQAAAAVVVVEEEEEGLAPAVPEGEGKLQIPLDAGESAAALSGRTSVNLNFTAGPVGMESAARQRELRTLVTSRAFVEKAKIELISYAALVI